MDFKFTLDIQAIVSLSHERICQNEGKVSYYYC